MSPSHFLLSVLVVLLGLAHYHTAFAQECKPVGKTTKDQCLEKLDYCANQGAPMKWTGAGCKINGKKAGDGGCQCKDYCGYKCKSVCKEDSECYWNDQTGTCWGRNYEEQGKGLGDCSATRAPSTPTTRRPTLSPTPKPTKTPTKPTTRQPTKRPTKPTKKPTMAPTKRPTNEPTKKPTKRPTMEPTKKPTKLPTVQPTKRPASG